MHEWQKCLVSDRILNEILGKTRKSVCVSVDQKYIIIISKHPPTYMNKKKKRQNKKKLKKETRIMKEYNKTYHNKTHALHEH